MRNLFPTVLALIAALSGFSQAQNFRPLFSFPNVDGPPDEALIEGSDGHFYGAGPGGNRNGEGIVYRVTKTGDITALHVFETSVAREGSRPVGRLVELGDGVFYGVTREGGRNGYGTIYKVTRAGVFTTLHHFDHAAGRYPGSGLTLGGDGNLYGTTTLGGTNDRGCVFRITPGGSFSRIYSFPATGMGVPVGRLTLGGDGELYGSTVNVGAIFKITLTGTITTLQTLTGTDIRSIFSPLLIGLDGNFYGAGSEGGTNNNGTVFRMTPAGLLTTLFRFSGTNGRSPNGLTLGPDGNFYGITRYGGASGTGTLFRVTPTGAHTLLRSFGTTDGSENISNLLVSEGVLHGVTGVGGAGPSLFSLTTGGAYSVIVPFGNRNLGIYPRSGLVEASDGNFYGTTQSGSGSVFRMNPAGGVTLVHRFNGTNGGNPEGSLIQGADGALYGVTRGGGANLRGTIYRLTLAGEHSILHSFAGSGSISPTGGLVEGSNGTFYGLLSQYNSAAAGSAYSITAAGTFTILHNFVTATDGGNPHGPLLRTPDGDLYGATYSGGGVDDSGTIFRLTPSGAITVIAPLPRGAYQVQGGLVLGRDGNFYGVTHYNGGDDAGAFFRCTPAGVLTIVTTFGGAKGSTPLAAPVLGPDGNFYGTTTRSVLGGPGAIYKITPSGVVTVLRNLSLADGIEPMAPVTVGRDGDLYGVASEGGAGGGGTIFSLDIFPTVTMLDPAQITPTSATLRATVNPNGEATTVEFFRGDASVGTVTVPAGNSPILVQKPITGLSAHTAYTARAAASNRFSGAVRSAEITFITPNTPPVALPLTLHRQMDAEGKITLDPSSAWSDADGDPLTITAVEPGQHGTLTLGPGIITYDYLDRGFDGNEVITYTISDGFGGSATGTLTLSNAPPTAADQAVHPDFGVDGVGTIDLSPSIGDPDGDAPMVTRVSQPAHAEVSFAGNVLTYKLTSPFSGSDSFTYMISDRAGGVATGTVTLTNAAPVAANRSLHPSFGPGGSEVIDIGPLVTDADGDEMAIESVTQGTNGQVSFSGTRVTYVAGAGFVGSDAFQFTVRDAVGAQATAMITLANTGPVAGNDAFLLEDGTATLDVLTNDGDADGDALTITAVAGARVGTVVTDGTTVTYTPGADFEGVDAFTYTITDGRGAIATGHGTVRADYVVSRSIVAQGEEVPGNPGATWRNFGVPSLSDMGTRTGFLASYRQGRSTLTGIFGSFQNSQALFLSADDAVTDEAGNPLPGTAYRRLEQPVFAGDDFAFVARLRGAGTSGGRDSGIWVGTSGTLRAAARSGDLAAGTDGARFHAFTSVALPKSDPLFFTAKLRADAGGVGKGNDEGLWTWSREGGAKLLLREGQTIAVEDGATRSVRAFRTLTTVPGSPGHARYDSAAASVDAVLTFADANTALATIAADGTITLVGVTGQADTSGRIATALGTPSTPGSGMAPVATAKFRSLDAEEPDYTTVFDFETQTILAAENEPAAGAEGALFRTFQPPVAALDPDGGTTVAFQASLEGTRKSDDVGIWVARPGEEASLRMVAREGAEPPGAAGARFAAFESLSVIPGRGPVFVAKLASGTSKVKPVSDRGCWAMTSDGTLRLLFREGDPMGGRTLQSFSLLSAVSRSSAQRRAWAEGDDSPSLIYRAHFKDGSQAIVIVSVP